MDRTDKQAALMPLFKVLDISNIGLYYKTDDFNFIGELSTEVLRQAKLKEIFSEG